MAKCVPCEIVCPDVLSSKEQMATAPLSSHKGYTTVSSVAHQFEIQRKVYFEKHNSTEPNLYSVKPVVLVSWGYHDKIPQIDWLTTTEMFCFTVLRLEVKN